MLLYSTTGKNPLIVSWSTVCIILTLSKLPHLKVCLIDFIIVFSPAVANPKISVYMPPEIDLDEYKCIYVLQLLKTTMLIKDTGRTWFY